MVLLENDAFLAELTKLFEKSRLSGAVSLTIKRFNGHNKPVPRKDSFQRCKQIPTGVLDSLKDKYKWAEETEEGKINKAEGSLTQGGLTA